MFNKCKNPFKLLVPEPKAGNRYIVPDIHGCCKTLKELINKIGLNKDDQLVFLGDYIDRGPDNKGVVDFILELMQGGYQVLPLRGNHDDDFVSIAHNKPLYKQWYKQLIGDLINADLSIDQKYLDFFESLKYYIETKDHLIVHGGFNPKSKKPFEDTEQMMWARPDEYGYDKKLFKNKTIIHGHTPFPLNQVQEMVNNREKRISLDNGCVFKDEPGYGNLLCLELGSYELTIQKNIEEK